MTQRTCRGALNNLLKVSEWSFSKSRRAESERASRKERRCRVPGEPHIECGVDQARDKRAGAPLGHHKRARTAAGAKRAGPVEISPLHPRPHPARARATPTDTRPSRCLRIPRGRGMATRCAGGGCCAGEGSGARGRSRPPCCRENSNVCPAEGNREAVALQGRSQIYWRLAAAGGWIGSGTRGMVILRGSVDAAARARLRSMLVSL